MRRKLFAQILRKRAYRAVYRADLHGDRTGYVIINDNARRFHNAKRNIHFFFEVRFTALYKHDFSSVVFSVLGIVGTSAYAGDRNVFEVLTLLIAENIVDEILCLCRRSSRFGEIYDFAVKEEVRRFNTADGGNGERGLKGGRRTDDTRIGVGSQGVAAVLIRTGHRVIFVTRRSDERNTVFFDIAINLLHFLIVVLRGKTCGRAERHIDNVYAERDAIFERGKNPRGSCARIFVGEHLHDRKLRVRRNARDRIVFACNNARNVRAVLGTEREHVRVLIRIVVCKRNFSADIYVLAFQIHRRVCRRKARSAVIVRCVYRFYNRVERERVVLLVSLKV